MLGPSVRALYPASMSPRNVSFGGWSLGILSETRQLGFVLLFTVGEIENAAQ